MGNFLLLRYFKSLICNSVAELRVFYKQFSLYFSLGYYLHRHTGHLSREFEKPYYETLGLRYTFPFLKNVYVGYHVKAHLFRADHIEFNVGWRIP